MEPDGLGRTMDKKVSDEVEAGETKGGTDEVKVSPLARAVELIKARDARIGPVVVSETSSADDIRAMREEEWP